MLFRNGSLSLPGEPIDWTHEAPGDPELSAHLDVVAYPTCRFRVLVQRIADWSDDEIAVVDARQTRHIARVVMEGAHPIYPPFGRPRRKVTRFVFAPTISVFDFFAISLVASLMGKSMWFALLLLPLVALSAAGERRA